MWKQVTFWASATALVAQAIRMYRAGAASSARRRGRVGSQDVQRWEDEGGSLPPESSRRDGSRRPRAAPSTRS